MRPCWRLAGPFAAVVATLLAAVTTAPPAAAHAELVSSTPAEGATVQRLPGAVTLSFSEPVRTPAFVEVATPGGRKVAAGDVVIRDTDVVQRLGDFGNPGRYALSYRVTSADGHSISGTVRFTVQATASGGQGSAGVPTSAPATGSTPTAAAQTQPAGAADNAGGGMGTPQLMILLAALAVGLAALAVGTRRALRHSTAMVDTRKDGRSGGR